jgi:phosphopantothenoylcysteine decarboxylase / phosphopantothenate---cysteine ligase
LATKKEVLITAGPSWVAIDGARVISNLSSGQTGFILAEKFKKLGAKVTLLLGPGNFFNDQEQVTIKRFKYYTELAHLLEKELKKAKYSAVIHAAAVADYQPRKAFPGKISSQRKNLKLDLVPTKKLIKGLKKYQPGLFAVGFKFEPKTSKIKLINSGKQLLKNENLDLVVANSDRNGGYQAYIIGAEVKCGPFLNKNTMAVALTKLTKKLF